MATLIEVSVAQGCILVFNSGSSSIKFSLYEIDGQLTLLYDGEVSGIGTSKVRFRFEEVKNETRQPLPTQVFPDEWVSFRDAVKKIAETLNQAGVPRPSAIGHRVVHSGPNLVTHQRISHDVLREIEQSIPFAPLHQPVALEMIREATRHFPGVQHYACFDTIFHHQMPVVASTYPIPKSLQAQGLRRYGFHGLSCESVVQQFLDGRVIDPGAACRVPAKLIIAHLGSGASITAVRNGQSIDTTMGLTPCGGVIMGTRSGDLDPGLILYLMRMHVDPSRDPVDEVEQLVNRQSGLLALSESSSDMRELREAAARGNSQAEMAIQSFILSAKKAIGGFVALLGGLDALVFTGGIGEHDFLSRSQICAGLDPMGIAIEPKKNEETATGARIISHFSQHGSSTTVYVIPTEEDRVIASHVEKLHQLSNKREY